MTRSKRFLLGTVAGLALLAAVEGVANADVPVIDTAALGEWAQSLADDAKSYALQLEQYGTQAKQWATQNLQWLQQVQQYALQGEQYLNELQLFMNFVHYPSLGTAMGVIMGAGLGNALPINPGAVLGLVNGLENLGSGNGSSIGQLAGVLGSLSALSGQAWSMAHVYTPTDGSWASAQIIARSSGIAGEQGAAGAAYTDLRTHAGALQPLRTNLLASTDTKAVLDATGQVNTEIAWNVNEMAQLEAVRATYEAQNDSIVQRDNECLDMNIEAFLAASPVHLGNTPGAAGACNPGAGAAVGGSGLLASIGGDLGALAGGAGAVGGDAGTDGAMPVPPVPPGETDGTDAAIPVPPVPAADGAAATPAAAPTDTAAIPTPPVPDALDAAINSPDSTQVPAGVAPPESGPGFSTNDTSLDAPNINEIITTPDPLIGGVP